jgi:phosphoenolpyruvate---glycerone phosphotransferase subunit DhaL
MRSAELVRTIDGALAHLEGCADELRDLDAALGDGDLGVTVASGCQAVRAALADLPGDAAPAQVLKAAAGAFAKANPSTMAALVGGTLLAAARGLADSDEVDRAAAIAIGRAAADSIATRGKAQLGDKTVLDALVPSLDAMETAPEAPLSAGIDAARRAVEETRSLQSMRGRASWMGERSKGLQDPGATAYLRFLEGLESARTGETTT